MELSTKKILTSIETRKLIAELGEEFVRIENPNYIFAPYEICPLATKIVEKRKKIVAVVQDMDGTTTTTEALCLHSLEFMTRCFLGKMDENEWQGLDRERDYPHIIGNSTTKHVEYLLRTYGENYDEKFFKSAYLRASLITQAFGRDSGRKRESLASLRHFGMEQLISEPLVQAWFHKASTSKKIYFPEELTHHLEKAAEKISIKSFSDKVRAAIEIYYQRYHEILFKIENNSVADLKQLIPPGHEHFIEPMPGVAIFLAAIKGWLGEELVSLKDELIEFLEKSYSPALKNVNLQNLNHSLATLGRYFQDHPVKTAVVTSSIFYEADIVLTQVFEVMRKQVLQWEIDNNKKKFIAGKFQNYRQVFDAIITASDSSEIRLKPHRDLYSLALHRLGIDKLDYENVIGFEDSESGTISIRAAGIGFCVAVPFADTQGHELNYASYILPGGLPEAMLVHHFFLETTKC